MVKTQYCVIGTGAGGGVLAHQLALSGMDVVAINSGSVPPQADFDNELSPQQKGTFDIKADMTFPAKADVNLAHPLFAPEEERSIRPQDRSTFHQYQIHHVNGLQNLWGAVSLRYSKDDFDNKTTYTEACQWNISYDEISPHYDAVETLAHVIGNQDHLDQSPDGTYLEPSPFRDIDKIFLNGNKKSWDENLYFFANRKAVDLRQNSPNRCTACGGCSTGCRAGSVFKFSTHLYPELKMRTNFRLLENTRCVRIEPAPNATSPGKVVTLDELTGERHEIEADIVIIAAGAFESARIMLNSFSLDLPGMSQVGKYIQDVPSVAIGTSLMKAWFKPVAKNRGYGDHLLIAGTIDNEKEAFPFVGQLWSNFMKAPLYQNDIQFLPRAIRKQVAKQLYRSTVALLLWAPAIPSRNNRVELSDSFDKYGQPQLKIFYERLPEELQFNTALEKLGIKLLRNASGYVASSMPNPPGKGIHYSGTCRMGRSPETGVVDKNLKFFGAKNIYVCDGGVIPQLGEKHPTLTIMALAHRLADHLMQGRS